MIKQIWMGRETDLLLSRSNISVPMYHCTYVLCAELLICSSMHVNADSAMGSVVWLTYVRVTTASVSV